MGDTAEALVLGIDVGTSGAKALVIDQDGVLIADAQSPCSLDTPGPGMSEQDPEDWFRAAITASRDALAQEQVDASRVRAIGMTGQMHSLVALDRSMQVIRPAILWNDQRSAPQCEQVTRELGLERLLEDTGNRMLPGFTAPKLLWMREHEPEAYDRIEHVLLPKDYIRHRFGSELATDVSDASGTSVFDCARRTWSTSMLDALDLPASWWPEAAESCVVVDALNSEVAEAVGLEPGIPIVAGAGDQAASAVGTGIVREGIVSATLGTSGVVFAASDTWRVAPEGALHAFCHAVPGMWHLMGVMLSAAGSLEWFAEAITPDIVAEARERGTSPFAELDALATSIEPGAEGLCFLPYLTGERTPHSDPDARGCFIGLTNRHDRAHMTRAVLEGVGFGMRDCLDLVRSSGVDPEDVRMSGGGAKSELWRRICADIFACPIVTTSTTEGTAFGAALLGGVGATIWKDVPSACDAVVQERERTEPTADSTRYDALHARYAGLYPALQPWWHSS